MTLDYESLTDGQVFETSIGIGRLGNGEDLSVPVTVLRGATRGPRLSVVAGVHGDEVAGTLAAQRLVRELQPSEMHGDVVFVHVANPPAFGLGMRVNPNGRQDMNRVYPGNQDGTVTERLAASVFENGVLGADLNVSLHSWRATGEVLPYLEFSWGDAAIDPAVERRSLDFARKSGCENIRGGSWPEGSLGRAALLAGIPALESEHGGRGICSSQDLERCVNLVVRLMRALGILTPFAGSESSPSTFRGQHVVASQSGIFRASLGVGDRAARGQIMGIVTDWRGRHLEEVKAPADCLIAAVRTFVGVAPNELLYLVLTEDEFE